MTLREKINNLLENNKTAMALNILLPIAKKEDNETHNTLILLKSQFTANESENNGLLLHRDDYKRTLARINHAILGALEMFDNDILEREFEEPTDEMRDVPIINATLHDMPEAPIPEEYHFNFVFKKNSLICAHFGAGLLGTGLVLPNLLKTGCKIVFINRPGDKWASIIKPEIKEVIIRDSNKNQTRFFLVHDAMNDEKKNDIINQWIKEDNSHIFLLTENIEVLKTITEKANLLTTSLKQTPAYQWCSQILNQCEFSHDTFLYPYENNRDATANFKKLLTNDHIQLKEVIADRLCSGIKISAVSQTGFIDTSCEEYGFVVINHSDQLNPIMVSKGISDTEIKFANTDQEFGFYHKRKFTLFNCIHAMLSCYFYNLLMSKNVPLEECGPYQLNVLENKSINDKIEIIAEAEIVYLIYGLDKTLREIVFPDSDNYTIFVQFSEYSKSILKRIFLTRDKLNRVLPIEDLSPKYRQRIKEFIEFYDDNHLQSTIVKQIFQEVRAKNNKVLAAQTTIRKTISDFKTILLNLTTIIHIS
jgi:hypothetical protein